jgi:predicted metal-dependent enzyme (double-stranded beta helix superfamily)
LDSTAWPEALDALTAAPAYHRLLFENDRVRVLEVRIGPGHFVPVHTHRWPSVVYTLCSGDFVRRDADGSVTFDSRQATSASAIPEAQWLGPLPPHSVENVGSSEIRLFTVELKNSFQS